MTFEILTGQKDLAVRGVKFVLGHPRTTSVGPVLGVR